MNKRLRKKLRKRHIKEFECEISIVNQLTFIYKNSVYGIFGDYKPKINTPEFLNDISVMRETFLKNRKSFKANVIKSLQELYNKEE